MAETRSIFEEVSGTAPVERSTGPGGSDGGRARARQAISLWLLILLALVVLMIVVGGLTRLTDSGLSITEWQPISGALPPLSDAAWMAAFEKYQQIPEYRLQNKGMSLAEFKSIYWWEWGHRQLGRLIGLVWALGFVWFLARRMIPTGWTGRLFSLGVLGGVQGALGWWMVSSGLTGRMVDVASYRLALHLGLAFVIIGLIAWFRMLLKRGAQELLLARRNRESRLGSLTTGLLILLFAQILLGALVAGLDAGRGYIDWPLMNGQFLPSESFDDIPLWTNFFENPALAQFDHRMLGYVVLLFALFLWQQSRKSALMATRRAVGLVMAMVALQMILGIATVLYAAPWQVAILHQIGAIVLILLTLQARFAVMYPAQQSLR